MSRNSALAIVVGALVLVALVLWFGMKVHYQNAYVRNQSQIKAEINVAKNTHDAMWKIIQEKFHVTESYRNGFDSIYVHMMSAQRGDASNLLLNFLTQSTPQFSDALYRELMVSIEAQRESFKTQQNKLADLDREQINLIDTWPGSMFLSGKTKTEIPYVRSTRTNEAYETGVDDKTL